MTSFKTLVFLDLETTGLMGDEPKITELAMIAVNIENLIEVESDENFPRVLNKFVKCFNPMKFLSPEIFQLTGLNEKMLIDSTPFNRETVRALETFLNDLPKPICCVAHNGNRFDFPILWAEIQSAISDENPRESLLSSMPCADSLVFCRKMFHLFVQPTDSSNNDDGPVKYVPSPDPMRQQPSMKLRLLYEREFAHSNFHFQAHRAEDDCLMLLAILRRYLIHWLEWMEMNHQDLQSFTSLSSS